MPVVGPTWVDKIDGFTDLVSGDGGLDGRVWAIGAVSVGARGWLAVAVWLVGAGGIGGAA